MQFDKRPEWVFCFSAFWNAAFFKSFTKLSVNKQESQSNTTLNQSKVCDTLSPFAIKKNTESKFDMYEEMTQLVWTCLIFLKASEKNNSKEILYKYEIWERERVRIGVINIFTFYYGQENGGFKETLQ